MSLMKNNTNRILVFLMALLMILQLAPFSSLAEVDPDSVETSEILEFLSEEDSEEEFEEEFEDTEPDEEEPEDEDEDLPDESEDEDSEEEPEAEEPEDEEDEEYVPESFEIEDLSDPEIWEALFDNPDVEIIMDAEIPEDEELIPAEEYTMQDMIQDNYDGSWIKYGMVY